MINTIAGEIQSPGQGEAVDAATVLLEADADRVYAVAATLPREKPEVRVLSQDAPRRAIAFAQGRAIGIHETQSAGRHSLPDPRRGSFGETGRDLARSRGNPARMPPGGRGVLAGPGLTGSPGRAG